MFCSDTNPWRLYSHGVHLCDEPKWDKSSAAVEVIFGGNEQILFGERYERVTAGKTREDPQADKSDCPAALMQTNVQARQASEDELREIERRARLLPLPAS